MLRRLLYGLMSLGGIGLLSACVIEHKSSLGDALQTSDVVYVGRPEALPSKVSVYTAMARAAKYNTDPTAQNMFKKVYDGSQNEPIKIAEGILQSGPADEKLYTAAKALDFADLYAMSVLTDNTKYVENTFYAKSAQNLSVAAIKLHRQVIFAEKEIRHIDRVSAQQAKILKGLNDKMEHTGDLTEPELNYKKGLEVALDRLAEVKRQLQSYQTEYKQLINTSEKELSLEGKRFYELDDFDKRHNPEVFQDAAATNRREFAQAKEHLGSFNAAKARRQAFVNYPPVARLDINGLAIEDSRYEKELYNKAERATINLLKAVLAYQDNPSKEDLHQKAFDELAAVVMTQVEIAYRLIEKATYDYEANRYKIAEIKKEIEVLEKKKNLPDYEKVDLLNKRVDLIICEQKEASILAERAATMRNLYYLSGLSPFDKAVLKGKIKDIEQVLKQAFSKDLVNMLSSTNEEKRWDDGGNAWAHKDKWLDKLMDPTGDAKPIVVKKVDAKPVKDVPAPAVVASVSDKTAVSKSSVQTAKPAVKKASSGVKASMIQLGAYTDVDNAIKDQNAIKEAVEALNGYDFFIEEAVVNGVKYHRLMVKPEVENLQSLCQQVTAKGFGCILK